ncbi:MAG: hypothetical protein Q8K49_00120 [Brevundimonas sp.]|nr:hypothetical protein [Brevundimonas sp.]MDP1911718.1 hypothetical protein [Brevundimonas sp.]
MGDWDQFGYRVIRNGLFGQEKERRINPTGGVQLARRVFAVAIDGRRLDAQTSGDLFGVHVRMDEAKTLALAVGQSINTARHLSPPRLPAYLNHRKGLTETGIAPQTHNQRLSAVTGAAGIEIAMEA